MFRLDRKRASTGRDINADCNVTAIHCTADCNQLPPVFIATAIDCTGTAMPTAMGGVSLRDTPQGAVTAVKF